MGRPPTAKDSASNVSFTLSNLFPEHEGTRGPLEKQRQIFEWIASGEITGGGAVYIGGVGSGKSLCGSAVIIWAHHRPEWKGLRSLIGRETFPGLLLSTADEFFKMVEMLPPRLIEAASKPSKNSVGWVKWAVGGLTLLASLSDSSNWESSNLGLVWVDEGHRQQQKIMSDLMRRIRQKEGPRVMLVTENPAGKDWLWKMASDESKWKNPRWRMVRAATDENPTLPADYIERLWGMYGKDTPAARRWIKGLSSALEGVAFTQFDPMPPEWDEQGNVIQGTHIIPAFEIPDHWHRSRGLDYGQSSPTAVVYGAQSCDPGTYGDWFIWKTHSQAGWTVPMHAEVIRQLDAEFGIDTGPADPSVFHKILTPRDGGDIYSTADLFQDEGIWMYPGANDRKAGLARLMQAIAPLPERQHLVTGLMGAPALYIFDDESNEPLIQCLSNLLWDKPDGTPNRTGPDDTQKKDDHEYDALRYLVMDRPVVMDTIPILPRRAARENSRGSYAGY